GAAPARAPDPMEAAIADYGLIGDARSAALVSCRGSIDWLCWPRFDSPPFLNRLLDAGRGGCFAITPSDAFSARRSYDGATALRVTEFHTPLGAGRVTDLMPARAEAEKRERPLPFRSVLRVVEG